MICASEHTYRSESHKDVVSEPVRDCGDWGNGRPAEWVDRPFGQGVANQWRSAPHVMFVFTRLMVVSALLGLGTLSVQAGQVTVEAVDRDLAITRATSRVPQGKTVTDTTCVVIDVANIDHYRCTVSWE